MSWAGFSIKNRYTVYALSLAVLVGGLLAWRKLPIALFPDTAPPLVNVVTAYPGATVLDVAEEVSKTIEEEIATLDGIARVTSVSQDGLSIVSAEFEYDRDVDLVAVDVQNALSRIRNTLPDVIAEPRVLKFSTSDKPVITLGVRGRIEGMDPGRVRQTAEDDLQPILQRTPDVAAVDVFGGQRPQVNVSVDRGRLESFGLTLSAVIRALREENVSAPAGKVETNQRELLLRFDQKAAELEDLERLPIADHAGQRILLGDIASVDEGVADQRSAFRVNGVEVVAIQILQRQDANTVDVVDRIEGLVPSLESQFPDLEITVASEAASFTEVVVSNMGASIVSALLLAAIVIFLFIGSLRGALVISLSMPMSFLLTLALMQFTGMELNLVTLSAVILAVGMVVDASVVVLENIARHRHEQNEPPKSAAVKGTDEVFFAILAGVMTTLIVLLPLLFLEGFVGKVFRPLATTLIYAFASSVLAAVTLIPLLASHILGKEGRRERRLAGLASGWFDRLMGRLRNGYMTLLHIGLRHRLVTLAGMAVLLAGSLTLLNIRGMEVLPRLDSGSFFVSLEAEPGSSFSETIGIVTKVEGYLKDEQHVVNFTSQVGFEPEASYLGDAGAMGVQQAFLTVDLVSRHERDLTIWDIEESLRDRLAEIPGIRTAVVKEMGGTAKSTTAAPLNVRISGPDQAVLDGLAREAAGLMEEVPGAVNIYRRWSLDRPEIRLEVDRLRLVRHGLTTQRLAGETYAAIEGFTATELVRDDGTSLPVVVRYEEGSRNGLEDVMTVRVLPGLTVREVAQPLTVLSPNLVTREGLINTADVAGFHYGRTFSHVSSDIEEAVSSLDLPQGYELSVTGESADLQESGGQMIAALLVSLVAVYLLLMAQFKSVVHPLTVMMAVPLVVAGVAAALLLADRVISLAVLTALILLVGIAVNNSIILLDFILERRRADMERQQAVVESVEVRFRPIMMTSFSTVIGMLPLALEWALGAERFSPMAVAIIGGLVASSMLTLVVIPVFYTVVDDTINSVKKMLLRPARAKGTG